MLELSKENKFIDEIRDRMSYMNIIKNEMIIAAVMDDPESLGTATYLEKVAANALIKAKIGDI